MSGAPVPPDEAARLLDLAQYHILDTAREEVFDRITRLAARLLRVPVAVVNFVDVDRQWGKAMVGLDDTEAPREYSFCAWAILQDTPFVVPDATADPRFTDNPMVTGEPHIHMYAAAPLVTPRGHRIGTLCITDDQPHPLDEEDLRALQDLAATAISELELRSHVQRLQQQVGAQAEREADLQRNLAHAQTLEAVHELMDLPLSPEDSAHQAAGLIGQAIHADWTGLVIFENGKPHIQRVYGEADLHPLLFELANHLNLSDRSVTHTLKDLKAPFYLDVYREHPEARPAFIEAGLQAAAWIPLGTWQGKTFLMLTLRADQERELPWRGSDRTLLEAAGRSVRAALYERARMEASLESAREDALTSVLNRRAFDEDLEQCQSLGEAFTLALMDLDGFKGLNDTEGHAQGDKVLQLFAGALKAELQGQGKVYRLGGDEFVLLLPGAWAAEDVDEMVDVAVPAAQQACVSRIGASVGVAKAGEAGTCMELIKLADARMYEVKRRRKALRTERKV
ncbi:sensor domain-containing diguanylate cyclase [Deinococcus hopiensis]|uniref:Diguanylate cyclase (GGDEF) domain-containing protein n=1 Tax=Deinococcus hopiensis KR-140 TaxID=695939 RepID=A0A1W1UX12_9DEIO|nr:sensor domain-containing diguanylate cyclase [Deinococcus hopiensis]SMB85570.1 diguanylate cyclase (GGDEF) domain-containing protein [Deinococcus hopiensis KR-140]